MPVVPLSAPYADYMQLSTLLSLQRPHQERAHPDELLFQTVHQVAELLLNAATDDIVRAGTQLTMRRPAAAEHLTARAAAIIEVATAALRLLARLPLRDYHTLRLALGTSTAAASPGWRMIRRAAVRLGEHFDGFVTRSGVNLADVYWHGEPAEVHRLAEAMVDLDTTIAAWRFHHHLVAARLVGADATGTGGMPVQALAAAAQQRMFDQLWQVRVQLTGRAGGTAATGRGDQP